MVAELQTDSRTRCKTFSSYDNVYLLSTAVEQITPKLSDLKQYTLTISQSLLISNLGSSQQVLCFRVFYKAEIRSLARAISKFILDRAPFGLIQWLLGQNRFFTGHYSEGLCPPWLIARIYPQFLAVQAYQICC